MTGLKWLFGLAVAAGLILLAMPGYVSAQSASVTAYGASHCLCCDSYSSRGDGEGESISIPRRRGWAA